MITAPYGVTPARSVAPPDPTTGTNTDSNSTNSAITNASGGAMGETQFLQLLVSQMKNQDPMNPMDGKDLAAQLAQFSSVEQLMNINTKLDKFTSLLTPTPPAASGAGSSTQGA